VVLDSTYRGFTGGPWSYPLDRGRVCSAEICGLIGESRHSLEHYNTRVLTILIFDVIQSDRYHLGAKRVEIVELSMACLLAAAGQSARDLSLGLLPTAPLSRKGKRSQQDVIISAGFHYLNAGR